MFVKKDKYNELQYEKNKYFHYLSKTDAEVRKLTHKLADLQEKYDKLKEESNELLRSNVALRNHIDNIQPTCIVGPWCATCKSHTIINGITYCKKNLKNICPNREE